ncbi:hypothetical protein [Lichenihabitans psoromatis]|uniref:hypothetical protein n=1 Tax=Lichenihabitans psoromatis TaxID=2528642 RepID=UPI00103858CE|nr:hypothetical protein [Lichenihabitans psoromatis]
MITTEHHNTTNMLLAADAALTKLGVTVPVAALISAIVAAVDAGGIAAPSDSQTSSEAAPSRDLLFKAIRRGVAGHIRHGATIERVSRSVLAEMTISGLAPPKGHLLNPEHQP